jgi:hypothetical protein
MPIFKERKMLRAALPLKYSGSLRSNWWLNNEDLIVLAKSCESIINADGKSDLRHNIEILKQEDNRFVFRIKPSSVPNGFVIKVFPLRCFRHRLKYHWMKYRNHRFAFGEAVNLLIAAEQGLNVPKVYGYGEIYGANMLIAKSVLILQNLADHTPIGDMLQLNKDDQEKCVKILTRANPFLVSMYRLGCNHISFNSGCIMLSNKNLPQNDFILDIEYASFSGKPSRELLMFEAATLAKYCKTLITHETMDKWVAQLLDAVEINDHLSRDRLTECFYYYFNTQLSRKERQKIGAGRSRKGRGA